MRPTRTQSYVFLSFILFLLILISCSLDEDVLFDAVVDEKHPTSYQQSDSTLRYPESASEEPPEIRPSDFGIMEMENRTTAFQPIHDAYIQNGQGFNQEIVRLEEDVRTSFLMFDLSQIDSIGGDIISANLQFIVNQEEGNGKIEIFKGVSSYWSEYTLSEKSAPKAGTQLGSTQQVYEAGEQITIKLDADNLFPEVSTFILNLEGGEAFAFASKENKSVRGSELVVTYRNPVTADTIVIENRSNSDFEEAPTQVETIDAETTDEETTEEVASEGESTEEETTVEETTEEETVAEETNEEEENPPNPQSTNSVPVAVVGATKTNGTAPLIVDFKGSDSSDDKGISAYSWDFKDGNTATTANAENTFAEAGTYVVSLTITDEEGLSATETITITVTTVNNAPIAKVFASAVSGTVPLKVEFTGSDSTDDKEIMDYSWDFKDGNTATTANAENTFAEAGTYEVVLTVTDAEGLAGLDTISITVNAPENEAPKAITTASIIAGEAPLRVDFRGSDSYDDKGIVNYYWDFSGNSSSDANTAYTFENPGSYEVTLTVTDSEGLSDTERLTISVNQPPIGNIECSMGGGLADDTGEKIWCWSSITIPEYSERKGVVFSNGQMKTDSDCYERQVTREGDRLKFSVNPTSPIAESWCDKDFNIRAEITTFPFGVQHPVGTEEWLGWTYEFGSNYKIDTLNPFIMFQIHNGIVGTKPLLSLWVTSEEGRFNAGEISLVNSANTSLPNQYYPTGIYPTAGQKLKMVAHVVWGDDNTGRLRIWIDDIKVHDTQMRNVQAEAPYGGNAKWGIYKWKWADEESVLESQQQGISSIETYLGTLRMVTRRPGNPDYGKEAYSLVEPD